MAPRMHTALGRLGLGYACAHHISIIIGILPHIHLQKTRHESGSLYFHVSNAPTASPGGSRTPQVSVRPWISAPPHHTRTLPPQPAAYTASESRFSSAAKMTCDSWRARRKQKPTNATGEPPVCLWAKGIPSCGQRTYRAQLLFCILVHVLPEFAAVIEVPHDHRAVACCCD